MKRTDPPLTSDNRSGASLSPTDFARRRAFDAIADFFERLHRPPFTVSQAVSIARALRPYAQQEARRRRAHGLTAPGRRKSTGHDHSAFQSREWVARCVRFAPATLRRAEIVVAAAELDPRFLGHVMRMDFEHSPSRSLKALVAGQSVKGCGERMESPAGARIRRALRKGTNADRDLCGLAPVHGAESFPSVHQSVCQLRHRATLANKGIHNHAQWLSINRVGVMRTRGASSIDLAAPCRGAIPRHTGHCNRRVQRTSSHHGRNGRGSLLELYERRGTPEPDLKLAPGCPRATQQLAAHAPSQSIRLAPRRES